MILLNGESLDVKAKFRPETFQLTLGEKDSTATITVGPKDPEIAVGDWLQDDTDPGKGVVWRAKTVDTQRETGTRTIGLEHIINTLKDTVLFGETSTATLGGGNAKKAIQYLLGKTGHWKLGKFDYDSASSPFEFSSESLMDAISTVCTTLEDCFWSYNLSAYPFKLNITKKSKSTVGSELRAGRNLSSMKVTVDRSRMYTRIYPIGADDLHLSGNGYLQKNTSLYGVICKVETCQAYNTEAQLRAWAADRLRRHCEPAVTVSISGLDLSAATGESLDKLEIGQCCRAPVPETGEVWTEWITRLQWRDKMADPEVVTVTLANTREDVATLFKTERATSQSNATGSGRAGKAAKKETDDKVKGIYTEISKTAEEIRLEAVNRTKELRGEISVQADRIGLLVEGTGANAKIRPAQITAAINNGSSSVYISADHIRIDGQTTVSSLMSGKATVTKLQVATLQILGQNGAMTNVNNAIADVSVVNKGNGEYQLQCRKLGASTWIERQSFKTAGSVKEKSGEWAGTNLARYYHVLLTNDKNIYSPVISRWAADGTAVVVYDNKGTEIYRAYNALPASGDISGSITARNQTSYGTRTKLGDLNLSRLTARTYIYVTVSCKGVSRDFYISVGD